MRVSVLSITVGFMALLAVSPVLYKAYSTFVDVANILNNLPK